MLNERIGSQAVSIFRFIETFSEHPRGVRCHLAVGLVQHRRRRNIASPLADVRGLAGRTRAIAAAIRIGIEENLSFAAAEECIAAAEAAGRPLSLC